MVETEMKVWERFYAPHALEGLTVLDVGAGCGETADFYLKRGARKVIAVEPDKKAFEILKANMIENNMEVEPINEYFALGHLKITHDFMKMDCEGGESLLLEYDSKLKPSVIEAHSEPVAIKLMKKFDLKRVYRLTDFGKPHVSILHTAESPSPAYRTTLRDYLTLSRVIVREIYEKHLR